MRDRAKAFTGVWLPLLILCPCLVWIALDHDAWPWDHAWFGAQTVDLYETLRSRPLEWPRALVHATPLKPPAVAWIGELFVPVGMALGSVDKGLLLSVWMTHLAALMVVYRALLAFSGGRAIAAAAGTLVTGAAPIFIGLSTQYLAEASQTFAVAWFVLMMMEAHRWRRSKRAAHLLAATSFAMLAKTTSPAFCFIPGMVALAALLRRKTAAEPDDQRASSRPWALAILLAVMACTWYGVNSQSVIHYVRTASFGPVAELYGTRESYADGFVKWCAMAWTVFFLWPVALLLAAVAIMGAAKRFHARKAEPPRREDAAAGAALLQVFLTLAIFSLSPVRDPRYLVALLPLVAVVVCWALIQHGEWASRVVIVALGIQLVVTQTQTLGLWPTRPPALRAEVGIAPALHVVHRDPGPAADLAAIVARTCPPGALGVLNFVGVDLLRISGHALTYAAAKERLAGRAGHCRYDSIGFAPVEAAEAEVRARPYVYWITVDPEIRPVPAHDFLNRSSPVLFRRLRRRGVLEGEPWQGPEGIRLFRFVEPR